MLVDRAPRLQTEIRRWESTRGWRSYFGVCRHRTISSKWDVLPKTIFLIKLNNSYEVKKFYFSRSSTRRRKMTYRWWTHLSTWRIGRCNRMVPVSVEWNTSVTSSAATCWGSSTAVTSVWRYRRHGVQHPVKSELFLYACIAYTQSFYNYKSGVK